MKKFLLTLLIFGLTTTVANATYHVHYSNTGAVASSHRGAPRHISSTFGRNAAFTPANRARLAAVRRQRQYARLRGECGNCPNNYNRQPLVATTVSTTPEISRFSKSYKITPQKSYTRNGITYYN